MLAFPPNPLLNQGYQNWHWDGSKWVAAANNIPQCGALGIVGSTPSSTLIFRPYNGDLIKINGSIYQIPSVGVAATTQSAYVDGLLTVLSVQFYHVYVWIRPSDASMQLDFSTSGPGGSSTPGNVGVLVKWTNSTTLDDSRTYIGCVYVPGVNFVNNNTQAFIRSWFNRNAQSMSIWMSTGGTFAGTNVPLITGNVVNLPGESIYISSTIGLSGAASWVQCWNAVDGTNIMPVIPSPNTQADLWFYCTVVGVNQPASGMHQVSCNMNTQNVSISHGSYMCVQVY